MAQVPRRPSAPNQSVRLAQATGMVAVQAGCTISTAAVLMQYRAELIGCTFGDIAAAVVERHISFDA
jgi:hypothetical protein